MADNPIQDAFNQGIKLGPSINKDRYICPDTGAHFEFLDMCRRMKTMEKQRNIEYKDLNLSSTAGKQLNKELVDQKTVQAKRNM